MSGSGTPLAGWTSSRFDAITHDAGSWLWGTVQGAFNEKSTLSQIIVDAVVGMIPLLGDATAVRDLIAVGIGMIDEPKKRTDKWQVMLLIVLLFALIPVAGGAIKGVGRILIKAGIEAEHLRGLARMEHLQQAANDIVAFLNRIGHGHAEKWLLKLDFVEHQAAVTAKFNDFLYTVNGTLVSIERKLDHVLSEGIKQRIKGLETGLNQLREAGDKLIPQGLKNLNATLKEIQQFVRSGGETTSRITAHSVVAGEKAIVTMTDELRLIEGAGAVRSMRGGWVKNSSLRQDFEAKGLYRYEPGYPNLTENANKGGDRGVEYFELVSTYSGKIVNRELEPGEKIFRVFGPVNDAGVHGYKQPWDAYAAGNPKRVAKFWGLGAEPRNAEEWRKIDGGVLDEWNHDGYILVGTVEGSSKIKACTGKIAEQTGEKIPGQYLPRGGTQAMIETPLHLAEQLNAMAQKVMLDGQSRVLSAGGFRWEIKSTGWTDVNGIHGYGLVTGKAAIQTARLGAREKAAKMTREDSSGAR